MFILCPSGLGISYLRPGYVTIASSPLKGGGKKKKKEKSGWVSETHIIKRQEFSVQWHNGEMPCFSTASGYWTTNKSHFNERNLILSTKTWKSRNIMSVQRKLTSSWLCRGLPAHPHIIIYRPHMHLYHRQLERNEQQFHSQRESRTTGCTFLCDCYSEQPPLIFHSFILTKSLNTSPLICLFHRETDRGRGGSKWGVGVDFQYYVKHLVSWSKLEKGMKKKKPFRKIVFHWNQCIK